MPHLSEAAQHTFNQLEAAMPKVSYKANLERLGELPVLMNITRILLVKRIVMQVIG